MHNSFGRLFRFTTWGESHGKAIGCVVDGVPAGISITESYIQKFLNERKPGRNFTSSRNEKDRINILSGVFEGKTLGSPISMIIYNNDQQPQDYESIKNLYRPGHADFTYQQKYGIRDYRGGGRASARETAMRVAAGAIARKIMPKKIQIRSAIIQIGPHKISSENWCWNNVKQDTFYCPDSSMVEKWRALLEQAKISGNSLAAIIETHVENVPVGLGDPIYNKLDANLASAIMGINAVKSVEIGSGFGLAELDGLSANDQMRVADNNIEFLSNNSGGIVGGISTGQNIVVRYLVKPTSSIKLQQETVDIYGNNVRIDIQGRHDPCVGLRVIPIGDAMIALVIADHYLLNRCAKIR